MSGFFLLKSGGDLFIFSIFLADLCSCRHCFLRCHQCEISFCIFCEEVKKSRKLLCSQVKIGSQVKQIVSGIKGHYTAEEMVGKKVMVLVNLKPAKLAGVLSEGMLLCAEDAEGNLALMTPEKTMPAGAEIC